MTRAFVDTNVFVYALGREHTYRPACRDLVERLRLGEVAGESSVEVLAEFVHVRGRRTDRGYPEAVERAGEIVELVAVIHDLELRDLEGAFELLGRHRSLRPSDAVHAATALNRGIEKILTADRHFDAVTGLERVDPLDAAAVEALSQPDAR